MINLNVSRTFFNSWNALAEYLLIWSINNSFKGFTLMGQLHFVYLDSLVFIPRLVIAVYGRSE